MPTVSPTLLPILMLFASNVFMTFAWYGHLKFKESPLPLVVLASWGIAFVEYWLAVPANRWVGWNHALGFACIAFGAFLIFHKWA